MYNTNKFYFNQRWFPCVNTHTEILLPHSPVRAVRDVAWDHIYQDEDVIPITVAGDSAGSNLGGVSNISVSTHLIGFTGPAEIKSGKTGIVTFDTPAIARIFPHSLTGWLVSLGNLSYLVGADHQPDGVPHHDNFWMLGRLEAPHAIVTRIRGGLANASFNRFF